MWTATVEDGSSSRWSVQQGLEWKCDLTVLPIGGDARRVMRLDIVILKKQL
jgi:hypothetical protein